MLGLDYSDYKFPEYLAPEILKEDLYDDKADIFAFGITLNELDSTKATLTRYEHLLSEQNQASRASGLRCTTSFVCSKAVRIPR